MFWSTEDHHRHHQPNYYNNFQIVQHQNGIQQATAAVPPQQHQQHPTPPPPLQQQQHQQQQQQQQQQHQHHQQSSHRTSQQIPAHYTPNQQMQQQHHQQWAPRPPLLTSSPFFPQFPTVPNSGQYCTAPPPFYHQQRVTQASAVSAQSQQRQCLPPGCAVYPIPPQAAGIRQNVITQPPATIMTPTTSTAQQMQVQYFSTSQYCQPPPLGQPTYGHGMTAPVITETPVVKHRKHAIPIIDPKTKENIFERELRRCESTTPADALSLTAISGDVKESEEEDQHIPSKEEAIVDKESLATEQEKDERAKENNEQVEVGEDISDSSVADLSPPPAVVDHVDSIEAKEEAEETTTTEEIKTCDNDEGVADQTEFISPATITNEPEALSKCSEDEENTKEETYPVEDRPPPTLEPTVTEKPPTSPKSNAAVAGSTAKVNKQQQTQKQQQPPPAAALQKPTSSSSSSKKSNKKNKRLKENQKKQQKIDLSNSNENNNNTTKITNQNDNKGVKQTMTEPSKLTAAAKTKENSKNCSSNSTDTKEVTAIPAECGGGDDNIMESGALAPATSSIEEPHQEKSVDESTYKENNDLTETNDDDGSPKLTKSEQIASDILGIEPTDDNELMFLNSSVSGYEEDISSSQLQPEETYKGNDILFGDFSQENPTQELSSSVQKADESSDEIEKDDNYSPLHTAAANEDKKVSYTVEQLKKLAGEPASKIPPRFRGKICDIIGKNPRGAEAAAHMHPAVYQHNQMFQQIPFKDALNCLHRKRSKRLNDVPPYQQFQQQQYEHEHDQQQQQHQRHPDIIRIYLSLNEEIQLAESENAWVPAGLQNCIPKAESEDDEVILKKIRGILNKLTPENFEKLLQSAAAFPMTGEERMKKVMLLIFEKTVSEPNFAPTYARFCKFLFDPQNESPGGKSFKNILIKRVQDEFESNVNNAKAKNAKLQPIMERLTAATDPKEQLELKAELDDQEYQFRRRAWGTVRFIGEMFKLGFLGIDRVCACVETLLDRRCEEKLEYMCKLLTTVGAQLEPLDKQRPNDDKLKINERLQAAFTLIKRLVEHKKGTAMKISSRVRFMMQDVLDLRARSWDQKSVSMLPSRELSPTYTRGPPPSQRGTRNYSGNYIPSGGYEKKRQTGGDSQRSSTQCSIDAKKLMCVFSTDETTRTLGNSSGLIWKTAGRPQQQQLASAALQQNSRNQNKSLDSDAKESTNLMAQKELSKCECERLINGLIEVVIEEESHEEWFAKWNEIKPANHSTIIYYILAEYLHSVKVKRLEIDACTQLLTKLMMKKPSTLLTQSAFNQGYQKFSEMVEEILVDVPKCWEYVFNVLGPLLHHKLLPFDLIWDDNWFNTTNGDKFLQSMIIYFTSEFGANYMRVYWENNSLRWNKFIAEERRANFIDTNDFEFIENHKRMPPKFIQRTVDEMVQRIKTLFGECKQDINRIIDFINTNVHIDCSFIQTLTMFLCDYTVIYCNTPNSSSISSNSTKKSKLSNSPPPSPAITDITTTYKLREDLFVTKCIPVLRLCIDSKDEHELSCLSAIVGRCWDLCDASVDDVICSMLMELYGEVISKESFEKWHQQQQQLAEGNDKKRLEYIFQKITNVIK